ncbi:MAG: CinA family nicotinamide mononucleotide deamidase-related protein [Thermodesulfobacteriota bacterium]
MSMRGEIITIGDELITGRVSDLNSYFLSGRVSSLGLRIENISSVGDDPERIIDALGRAVGRSEFVLVTGGLGPTDDDITTRVAAEFFGRPLLVNEPFLHAIQAYLAERSLPWLEAYGKMALLPEGAELIDPTEACGFYLLHGRVPVYFLPGVPEQVRLLAETKVLPLLLSQSRELSVVRQRVFKVFGLPEAKINQILSGLNQTSAGILIGYYPSFPENHVTVTVRAATADQADLTLAGLEAEVEKRLGPHLIAKDEATLEETVGRLLRARGLTLAVAESCTGGLISHRLTSVSGSSDYFDRGLVVYGNRAKIELLGVPAEIIETKGAVSPEAAEYMARGARERSGTDLGLASTGIAGPTGGTPDKPVGTVYLALAAANGLGVRPLRFHGRRDQITILTAQTALSWLRSYLLDDTFLHGH